MSDYVAADGGLHRIAGEKRLADGSPPPLANGRQAPKTHDIGCTRRYNPAPSRRARGAERRPIFSSNHKLLQKNLIAGPATCAGAPTYMFMAR